jgi:hypothetical protein
VGTPTTLPGNRALGLDVFATLLAASTGSDDLRTLLGMEGKQSMQISLNAEALEKLYTHATTARRLAGYIDAPNALEPLSKPIGEIVSVLVEILNTLQAPRQDDQVPRETTSAFDVANSVDDLRQLVARAGAFASAVEILFEQVIWAADGDGCLKLERLVHLVGATNRGRAGGVADRPPASADDNRGSDDDDRAAAQHGMARVAPSPRWTTMQCLTIEVDERAGITDGLTLSASLGQRCGGEPTTVPVLSWQLEMRKSRSKQKAR